MNLLISHDNNGNKVLKVTIQGERGFSVQTLGNLPETHRMLSTQLIRSIAENELNDYVKHFGTKRQKDLIGWYS